MNILFITNMLPVADYKYFGIHVKEQIDSIDNLPFVNSSIEFINGRLSKFNYFRSIFHIPRKVNQVKPDIIHIHYGISGIFVLFFKPNRPLVLTLHSGEIYKKKSWLNHFFQKNLTFRIIRRVDKVIILNDDMASLLNSYSDKLIKIPCGIDIFKFSPINELRNSKEDSFVIGFPGNRHRPEKNFHLFQNIISALQSKFNIEVIEFNNMTREQVHLNLNKLDILLMTSTIEGSPQIIKEAMACNIPVVSTNVGDVKDLLKNVDNSYVIDSFQQEDFVETIIKILTLPNNLRVSNGRSKLQLMGLDIDSVRDKIFSVYKSLL